MASERRIGGGTVVTQDDSRRIIDGGEVAYSTVSGRITYVGPSRGPGAELDATGQVVIPGLVNAHTHSAMTPLRGYSDDRDLMTWLAAIRDFEELMTYDDVRAGLRLALAEMIAGGTTCFADMFMWDETLLDEVRAAGLRVLAAPAAFGYDGIGYPGAGSGTGRDALATTERLAAAVRGDELVRIAFGPHAPYTCSPEMLTDVARRARAAGLPVHIHLSETATEVERSVAEHGCTPIELARRCGLFDGRAHVAHAVHATPADIAILAAAEASVSHNPVSNLKLGAGIAPLVELRAAGVLCSLGTDSVASNNSLDLFEEIKTAAILPRGVHRRSDAIGAAEVLDMATRDGARALGFPDSGRLEVGAAADIAVVEARSARACPLTSPVSFLAFAARGADVRTVVVAGRELMRDGVVLSVDEESARAHVAEATARILDALSSR